MFAKSNRLAGVFALVAYFVFNGPSVASASVVGALTQAGFQCSPATSASGAKFGGTLCTHAPMSTSDFTLSESFAVFVPTRTVNTINHVVLYFQGFRGVCGDTGSTPGQVMNTFELGEQMQSDSSANSVLLFPMSVGNDTTYKNDFASASGPFSGFMQWMETIVGASARWTLAGHSGAGAIIAKSLTLNPSIISKFDAIQLLDAAYSMSTVLPEWKKIAQVNPEISLSCIGNGTYSGCEDLEAHAGFRPAVKVTRTSTAHCDIPKTYFGSWLAADGN